MKCLVYTIAKLEEKYQGHHRPSTIVEEAGGETPLRNAHIAAGKAFSILSKMEVQGFCSVERSSVYGAAIAIPQVARSADLRLILESSFYV